MKRTYEKGVAVFFSFLIVFAVFNFALIFNVKEVSAANVDTCSLTEDGNYCVEVPNGEGWGDYGGCVPGHEYPYTMRIDPALTDCNVGWCVPSGDGSCLSNVEEIRCTIEQSGAFYLNEPVECNTGCCELYSSSCSLEEQKVCQVDLGGVWSGPSDDAQSCNLQCAGSTLGCYKEANGFCEYGLLEEFQNFPDFDVNDFYITLDPATGPFCSDVVGCPSYNEGEAYHSCGDGTTDDDIWDVYHYDSEGNREAKSETCGPPDSQCQDPDGKGGEINGECVTTDCIEDCPDCYPNSFRSGESVCVNVLDGFFHNSLRSRYLENYQINCQNGVVAPQFSDDWKSRDLRCSDIETDDGRFRTNWIDNEWESCAGCGENDGFGLNQNWLDFTGFAPIIGPNIIIPLAGNGCELDVTCSDKGDCRYDRDIWAPIGSCNPKYPPGTIDKCGDCGLGGDRTTNLCTLEECNALGDCVFEEGGPAGYGTAAALALGTLGSCVAGGLVLWAIPGIGPSSAGAAWSTCYGLMVGLGGPQLLFWGAATMVYGSFAASGTQEEIEYNIDDQIYHDGDLKMAYALISAKSFLDNLDEETLGELENEFVVDEVGGEGVGVAGAIGRSLLWGGVVSTIVAPTLVGLNQILFSQQININAMGAAIDELFGIGEFYQIQSLANVMVAVGLVSQYVTLAESIQTGNCYAENEERPITNSDSCEQCGTSEGQWYCTKDRCEILGGYAGWCQYIPFEEGGTLDGLCLPDNPDDTSPPSVESVSAQFYNLDNETLVGPVSEESGNSLDVNELIPWSSTYANVNITTSEEATCSYSLERDVSYSGGTRFTADDTYFSHGVKVWFDEGDRLRGEVYVYIKCKDYIGNEMDPYNNDNFVSFEFESRPDREPPVIDYIAPLNPSIPEGTDEVELNLFAYDPGGVGDCRYSKESEVSYIDMTGFGQGTPVQCTQVDDTCKGFSTVFDLTERGWGIELNESEGVVLYPLYILCEDLGGNVMYDPFEWALQVWPGFEFTIVSPTEGQQFYDDDVQISVLTGRDTTCTYTLVGGGLNIQGNFSDGALGTEHISIEFDLPGSPGGENYDLEVTCTDYAGNEVMEEVDFYLFSDVNAPRLLRLYTSSNRLNIVLDEEASCVYRTEELDERPMIGSGFTHSADLDIDSSRYEITCIDTWDNEANYVIYP